MAKQRRISETFISLADTLVDDYDLIDFLQQLSERCVEILGVTDAGIVLVQSQSLQVLASSSERMHLLELFELQRREGPCQDALHVGAAVSAVDLEGAEQRWPLFATAALAAGYRSAYAHPMRLRDTSIGALNLFVNRTDGLDADGQALAQAFADMATIGIVHERVVHEREVVAEQLQAALTSRIIIEQAKGVIAEQAGLDMPEAFTAVRTYARNANLRLTEVARDIVDRRLSADQIRNAQRVTSSRGSRTRR